MPVIVYQGFLFLTMNLVELMGCCCLPFITTKRSSSELREYIIFDPSFNPDGLQRFSQWANTHKAQNITPAMMRVQ